MQLNLRAAWMTGTVALAALALAGCVPAPPAPTPAPAPAPAPPAPPAPPPPSPQAPAPSFGNWMDAPITPGDWSYRAGMALFGPPGSEALLTLRCDRAGGAIEIARSGPPAAQAPMILRAEAMERSLVAAPAAGPLPAVVARLAATDPLLDAMAFSKGRFAVEVGGLPTFYVPSYPEITRVIEDCR